MTKPRFQDDDLRAAYQAWADQAADAADLEAEQIWDAVEGTASAEARRRVVDEMARRPGVGLFWKLAQTLQDSPRTEDASPGGQVVPISAGARAPFRAPRWAAAIAAGVIALVGGSIAARWALQPDVPGHRIPQGAAIRSGIDPDVPLDRKHVVLRWNSTVEHARYDVRITTASLDEILSASDLTQTELLVPAEKLESLAPGTKLFWHVTARHGRNIVSSETFIAEVR